MKSLKMAVNLAVSGQVKLTRKPCYYRENLVMVL